MGTWRSVRKWGYGWGGKEIKSRKGIWVPFILFDLKKVLSGYCCCRCYRQGPEQVESISRASIVSVLTRCPPGAEFRTPITAVCAGKIEIIPVLAQSAIPKRKRKKIIKTWVCGVDCSVFDCQDLHTGCPQSVLGFLGYSGTPHVAHEFFGDSVNLPFAAAF